MQPHWHMLDIAHWTDKRIGACLIVAQTSAHDKSIESNNKGINSMIDISEAIHTNCGRTLVLKFH